jgi:chromosome segregation ATPase
MKILKGIAIAAGAGLAAGVCASVSLRRTTRAPRRAAGLTPDEILRLEPVLDRLDRIETRMESELGVLRAAVSETEQRAAAAVGHVEERLAHASGEIPLLIASRVSELETKVEAKNRDSLAVIEKNVQDRVSERISSLERLLLEQSASIDALRTRVQETDTNIERLVAAIEKLCERTQPFQYQLQQAIERPAPAEFQPRIVKESEPEAKKSRMPFSRVFTAILTLGLSRLIR